MEEKTAEWPAELMMFIYLSAIDLLYWAFCRLTSKDPPSPICLDVQVDFATSTFYIRLVDCLKTGDADVLKSKGYISRSEMVI